ncbi:baseplate J/gp47 family protein [Cellvibrio mixtus]|uniref:baseplate J/gp47 family protein n=1 Tax=Cellvibrio mixtus TaxID=39650 RepID=UPI000587A251|nr:baseplate J/gp47 family protein [Cellvibrio mixtus]
MNVDKAKTAPQLHVRDGMSQRRRFLPALQPGYFNVDEMGLEQLLTQMQDYARLVDMPGVAFAETEIDPVIFARDEIIVMAQILAVNTHELENRFKARMLQELDELEWVVTESKNPASVSGLACLIDRWWNLLRHSQSPAGEAMYGLLESVIRGLAREFVRVYGAMPERIKQSRNLSEPFVKLMSTEAGQWSQPAQGLNEIVLRSIYASLLKAVDMVQAGARAHLPASMHSQNHDPALALRVAFTRLYQLLQQRVNRFTLDFIDFYFNQVLQARARPAHPDSVYLVIAAGIKERYISLPKGTEFFAGIDNNSRDIVYASDEDTLVTDAEVQSLYSLFFPRVNLDLRTKTIVNTIEPLVAGPETPIETDAVEARALVIAKRNLVKLSDGAWLNQINAEPRADKKVRDKFLPQPFFGAPRVDTSGDGRTGDNAQAARLGFAVASQVLLLREGQRQITVDLVFETLRAQPWSKLANILRHMPTIKDTIADDKAKFFAYFSKMFQLSLTTVEGWLDIVEYKPAYQATDSTVKTNAIRLEFCLPESAPAISAYNPVIHGDQLTTILPVLRCTLRENYLQYPYDIVRQLVLREVRIRVDVTGCSDLLLHNNIGQLSPLSPFQPFGPMPEVGSYFIVGHEETRSKNLLDWNLDIEWSGLPTVAGGFNRWYGDYLFPRDNNQFVVNASVLANGRWQAAPQTMPLFAQGLKNGSVYLKTDSNLSAGSAIIFSSAETVTERQKIFTYSPLTRNGLFKFTLQGPVGAFGHREYPNLLAETLTHNTRVKNSRLARSIPNPPYTPEINSIRLNYSAQSIITLADTTREVSATSKEQYFHLHPLGWELISPLRHSRLYFLPQYAQAGSLFIGIDASDIQQLSLLFHLKNNSLPVDDAQLVSLNSERKNSLRSVSDLITWHYLSENQWRPLDVRNILSDSTQGFMTSGIVTLLMPEKMTKGNSIMPGNLYWLKITADDCLAHFSELFSVYAQAVKASWISGDHPLAIQPMQLPADTIKRTRQTIAGINGVMQISNSFGGVPAESNARLRRRISERLRHKNRALAPLDYEMLILEAFPQVFKAKCFANLRSDPAAPVSPGHILIVVVPHPDATDEQDFQPYFDGHTILEIKEFIQALVPEAVKIAVENPLYEEIQVRCAVHFRKGLHAGRHQNLLNQALCDYLSPWSPGGNTVHFGWSLSEQEIRSFIQNLEYIDHVTDFSLLRIAPSTGGLFLLDDTAEPAHAGDISHTFKPTYPWSTAVPIRRHYLLTTDLHRQIRAERTGVDELEVGSTFIISG